MINNIFEFATLDRELNMTNIIPLFVKGHWAHNSDDVTYIGMLNNTADADLIQSFERNLIHELSNQKNVFFDFRKVSDSKIRNEIFKYLNNKKYDFVICNDVIANLFEKNSNFQKKENPFPKYLLHQIHGVIDNGSIGNINIYVDPFIRYDDSLLICGKKDHILYNYEIIDNSTENKIDKKLYTSIKINTDEFEVINILDDRDFNNKMYNKYKSSLTILNRDNKIDDILNK